MVRFRITVHCDHPGCPRSAPGDCRVDAGSFMPRGVFDVQTPELEQWYQRGSRFYCEEHKAEAGAAREGEP